MGTRALTFVYDEKNSDPIINLYRQFDGYPNGHGTELAEYLQSFAAITDDISFRETGRTANGMGCLAAQLVAHFKESAGGFYLFPVSDTDCGQDYEYHVYLDDGQICLFVRSLFVRSGDKQLFEGTLTEFNKFIESYEY